MINNLVKICTDKISHVERNEYLIPSIVHLERAKLKPQPLGFVNAIRIKKQLGEPALIAEIKKSSPNKGIIRIDFDPATIAMEYQKGGATCISVMTDTPYFKGTDDDLETAKSVTNIPVMRNDFIITEYQLGESRAIGADCILLIVAILDDETLHILYNAAIKMGMDVMVEVHNEKDLERALTLNPQMIGVNSCNLETFEIDIPKLTYLVNKIPTSILRIAESGIDSNETIKSLHAIGYDGFLVGDYLMRQNNIVLATKKLLGKDEKLA